MLTHTIQRYSPPPGRLMKQKFKAGSAEHRLFLFKKTLTDVQNDSTYEPGNHVIVRGNKKRGVIVNIVDDITDCKWDGLKVQFIEVYVYTDNDLYLYHPSDLKESK